MLGALLVALIIAGSYFAWTRWLGPARGRTEGVSTAADSAAPPTVAPAAASAPLAGAQQPLVSDEAVSWAETNSFDRYQARQKLEEGRRYLQGDGVPVDYERARLLLVAAAASEGRAAFHLFEIYGNGLGVVPDINASFQWLGRAAELGDAQGQYVLARFYIDGFSNILAPDQALADRWMRASAAQGYQPARDYLTERDRIP